MARLKAIAEIIGKRRIVLPAKRQDAALRLNTRQDVEFERRKNNLKGTAIISSSCFVCRHLLNFRTEVNCAIIILTDKSNSTKQFNPGGIRGKNKNRLLWDVLPGSGINGYYGYYD